jgi:NAD(P)H-hydrate epimerase
MIRETDNELVANLLPRRAPDAHKGSQGHVLTLAGSLGMTGAAVFAASAAFRAGAGLVTMYTERDLYPILAVSVPEALFIFPEDGAICFTNYDALAVGCGLTNLPGAEELVRSAAAAPLPQVWDAEALNIVSRTGDIKYPADCVITPHPGEMARLCGVSAAEIQRGRVAAARRYADEKGVVTVLKGHRSVIALPGGDTFINTSGSAAMASAGMGDALAGVIAALLAQGLDAGQAAICGVYWHGLSGQRLPEGMTVTDLIRNIPKVRDCLLEN